MSDPTPPPNPPQIPIKSLAKALGDQTRWLILQELGRGEALPVRELARCAGCTPNLASKHMAVLRETGLVEKAYGSLYRLASTLRFDRAAGILDLGHCLLRFPPVG